LFAPGAEASAPTLVIVSGAPNHRDVLRLAELDRRYVVGRVEGCDLRLAVEEISREHAAFMRRWNGVFVNDLGSKNGVRVNGALAQGQGRDQRVRDGDLIQIGPASLRLFDPEDRYLREFEHRADAAAPGVSPTASKGPVKRSAPEHSQASGPAASAPAPSASASDRSAAARSAGARAPSGTPASTRLHADLHPAIRAALAIEHEPSALLSERTILRALPGGARAATLVAATVLALLAAVAVTLIFG
jgi:hypothetical protein